MKRPWSQWYWGDWMSDPGLRMSSPAARGIWMDMLCIMHQSEPEGYLLLNGDAVTPDKLAVYSGCNADAARQCMDELLLHGVTSVTDDGIFFCRRMVRDAERRGGTRDRVRKYRKKRKSNADSNADVTPVLEASNHKPEGETPLPPEQGDEAPPAKKKKRERPKFIKPTIEEIRAHAKHLDFADLDAEEFMAHYEANGWMAGRVPLKCWRSAIVTWKKSSKKRQGRRDPSRPIHTQGAANTVDEYYDGLGEPNSEESFDEPT